MEIRGQNVPTFPVLQPGCILNLPPGVGRGLTVKGRGPCMPLCPCPGASSAEAARDTQTLGHESHSVTT